MAMEKIDIMGAGCGVHILVAKESAKEFSVAIATVV